MASVPTMKKLLSEARGKGMMVVHSVSGTAGADKSLPDIAPSAGEPVVRGSVDKFVGGDLEKLLKDKGIESVIVTGTGVTARCFTPRVPQQ